MRFHNSLKRLGLLVAICAAFALVTAGSALATGSASVAAGKVTFTAGAGDDNSVTYDGNGSGWEISDVNPITPGTGCTAVDSDTVQCGPFGNGLIVNLGDQDDSAAALDPSTPLSPVINGGDGNDGMTGSGASLETFNGDAGDDTIHAEGGNDTINGGADDDTLYGGDGNDMIDGGTGADGFGPGNGTDTLNYSSRSADLYVEVQGYSGESGEGDQITQFDSFEVYNLGTGNDEFYGVWSNVGATVNGGNGTDTIHGTSYNDTLNGQGNIDTYRGGLGDDTLQGVAGDDFRGDGGFDTVTFSTQIISMVVTVDDVADDGPVSNPVGNVRTDIEKVIGSMVADTITGQSAAATQIFGGNGADVLVGGSAADTIDGGSSGDTITPGGGSDTVTSGSEVDTIWANDGAADSVNCGSGSPDKAHADTTIDTLTGCESITWY